MDARWYPEGRKQPVWFSPFFLVVALSPAFLQITCERMGDTRLASLELEVLGVDRLAFDPMVRVYDLWLPAGAATATVRAVPMDPAARVTWYVPDGAGMLASGIIGVGGGEVTIDLPPDGYSLYIGVFPSGGAVNTYIVAITPACSPGSACSDGNECTADYCDPGTEQCVLTPVADDTACDFGGLPGLCFAGECEGDASCPVLTSVSVAPLQADVGDEINVSAEASGAGPIDYLWTATGGSFVEPSLPITAYRCEEPGQQDLTITISDGTGSCTDQRTVAVTCLPLPPCEQYGADNGQTADQAGGDAACGALLTTVCQSSVCDDSSGSAVCVDSNANEGGDCSAENPPVAFCLGGVCGCFEPNEVCYDGNPCTVDIILPPDFCLCGSGYYEAAGTACDAGSGSSSGACDGAGACFDI